MKLIFSILLVCSVSFALAAPIKLRVFSNGNMACAAPIKGGIAQIWDSENGDWLDLPNPLFNSSTAISQSENAGVTEKII